MSDHDGVDEDDAEGLDESVTISLDIHLSQSDFLNEVVESLRDSSEIWDVEEASVRLIDVNGEPTFVVEAQVRIEGGMTAIERGKRDTVTQVEFFLRTNPH